MAARAIEQDALGSLGGRGLDRLAAMLPRPRAIKTALAVGIAWWLGMQLGNERPIFAAMGALVGTQATTDRVLKRVPLQVGGMLAGIVLAFAMAHLFGMSSFGIGFAVLLVLWLGRGVGAPRPVAVEVGTTMLLVIGLAAGQPDFAIHRVWETVLGIGVAMAINVLVLPQDYLAPLAEDVRTLLSASTRALCEAARTFREQPHAPDRGPLERLRAVRDMLPNVRARFGLADSALRFSPLIRDRRATVERYRPAIALVDHAASHAANLARVMHQQAASGAPPRPGSSAPDVLVRGAEALAATLDRYETYVRTGDQAALATTRRELQRTQAALAELLESIDHERSGEADVRGLIVIAAGASELEHLTEDLANALAGSPRAFDSDHHLAPATPAG